MCCKLRFVREWVAFDVVAYHLGSISLLLILRISAASSTVFPLSTPTTHLGLTLHDCIVYGLFCLQKETHKMGVEQFCHLCYLLLVASPKGICIFPYPFSSDILKYIPSSSSDIFSNCSVLVLLDPGLTSVVLRLLPVLLPFCNCFYFSIIVSIYFFSFGNQNL